jgi:outer membrane protein assembly factor BamB
VVAGGIVYVGAGNGTLYALDDGTGATVWTAVTGASISDHVAVADGTVYVRSYDGNAYAFDAATGAVIWSDTTAIRSTSGIFAVVVANGAIYASRRAAVTAHHP